MIAQKKIKKVHDIIVLNPFFSFLVFFPFGTEWFFSRSIYNIIVKSFNVYKYNYLHARKEI